MQTVVTNMDLVTRNEKSFVLKGDICFSSDLSHLKTYENHYLICENGFSAGVFEEIPEKYKELPLYDYSNKIIIPGLIDLHIHASQYPYRGLGMDLELLDWLETHAFPEESKYQDIQYAKEAYGIFVEDVKHSATTRMCAFATLHSEATRVLMELLNDVGIKAYVGKVNMDRNCPDYLREESVSSAAKDTDQWVLNTMNAYENVKPILTPRFTPTCSDDLMKELGKIQKKTKIGMQSHLSENLSEIEWVKELCPNTAFYGEAYHQFGLFGGECNTIMAHCVYSNEDEMKLMKDNGVMVAICPQSNTNIASGIAPTRKYIENGLKLGLGSDIAGGSSLSMFRAMTDAIQCSRLYWRLIDQSAEPLKVEEAFYLGTMGGGEYFGKVGSFLPEYEFDAVIIDDTSIKHPQPLTLKERLERIIYLSDDRNVIGKYVAGVKVL